MEDNKSVFQAPQKNSLFHHPNVSRLYICVIQIHLLLHHFCKLHFETICKKAKTLLKSLGATDMRSYVFVCVWLLLINRCVYFSPHSTSFTSFQHFCHWAQLQLEVLPQNIMGRNDRSQQSWVNFDTEQLPFKAIAGKVFGSKRKQTGKF